MRTSAKAEKRELRISVRSISQFQEGIIKTLLWGLKSWWERTAKLAENDSPGVWGTLGFQADWNLKCVTRLCEQGWQQESMFTCSSNWKSGSNNTNFKGLTCISHHDLSLKERHVHIIVSWLLYAAAWSRLKIEPWTMVPFRALYIITTFVKRLVLPAEYPSSFLFFSIILHLLSIRKMHQVHENYVCWLMGWRMTDWRLLSHRRISRTTVKCAERINNVSCFLFFFKEKMKKCSAGSGSGGPLSGKCALRGPL